MNKKLAYQIEITLQTDGDFCLKKELLPPDFFDNDCREITKFTEDTFKCNIYEKDMSKFGWKSGEWSTFITRSTFDQFISAIHVGYTHLYIWKDLLECLNEIISWIYSKEEKPSTFISSLYGNYDGTNFIITKK